MRTIRSTAMLAGLSLILAVGCTQKAEHASVKDSVEKSLTAANLGDIKVAEDRTKGLLTLQGDVKSEAEKAQAEEIAKSNGGGYVVSNELGVRPVGAEGEAKAIDKNLDEAIEHDFKAALVANKLEKQRVSYHAKNGVLTLEGRVDNTAVRDNFEKLAAGIPNVQEVANKLDVKGKKSNS